jgi:hypothetical protein
MPSYIYSIVIGTVLYAYVNMFNKSMDVYKKSDYTMTWGQFIDQTSFGSLEETP